MIRFLIMLGISLVYFLCWTGPLFAWMTYKYGVEKAILIVIACFAGLMAFTIYGYWKWKLE